MTNFTPWTALLGGVLIGLSAAGMLWFNGRVAGITGIVGELFNPSANSRDWRLAFLGGLGVGALLLLAFLPGAVGPHPERSLPAVAAAGLLVGFGTRMGNGCTSGHGVCGIPRGSTRSLAATGTFMAAGALTVLVVNRVFGGVL